MKTEWFTSVILSTFFKLLTFIAPMIYDFSFHRYFASSSLFRMFSSVFSISRDTFLWSTFSFLFLSSTQFSTSAFTVRLWVSVPPSHRALNSGIRPHLGTQWVMGLAEAALASTVRRYRIMSNIVCISMVTINKAECSQYYNLFHLCWVKDVIASLKLFQLWSHCNSEVSATLTSYRITYILIRCIHRAYTHMVTPVSEATVVFSSLFA